MTLYLSFSAGGFFAGAPAVAATALGVALILRILIAPEPFAGLRTALVISAAFLGLFGVWTLVSAIWSDASAQAMIEFDRVLLYWLALVLFGSFQFDRRTFVWAIRALAGAIAVVALAALITRILPDVWSAKSAIETSRLSHPLTYWNGLGLLMAIGIVLCVHLSAATSGSRASRVLASSAVPVLAATLYFTFSRGGVLAAILGLGAYAILARPKGILSAVMAAGPATAVLVVVAYQAELLAKGTYDSPAGIDQGGEVALVAIGCVIAAAVIRLWLSAILDPRLDRWSVSARGRRRAWIAVAAIGCVTVAVGVAGGAPSWVGDQYDAFTEGESIEDSGDLRGRLTDVSNNGRLAQWRVALDTFEAQPLRGEGAGTFARVWARDGEEGLKVEDAHSLYLEVLAELGLVGLALLGAAILALLVGLAARLGEMRPPVAALLAAGLTWVLHAGVDWDWEMPATGFWLFALGGLALSSGVTGAGPSPVPPRFARLVLAVGLLAVLLTPIQMALSQGRLNSSLGALRDGDCEQASRDALAAAELVPARPQPFQVLSYCNSRAGEHGLAIEMAEAAIERDPQSWESHYGLALVLAAAGKDPRAAADRALALSPNAPLARDAKERFATDDPREWRRRATKARLPIL